MTRLLLRKLALALPLCAAMARAQTPTPTPTVTPTPPPNTTFLPAAVVRYTIPNGGRYDSSNLVLDPDGSLWAASGTENVLAKLSPDGATVTRWPFALDATPNSLLRDPDGTFWLTELGGFNVAHFDPATGSLTEWPDIGRRPTALVKRADGKFWLPETGGALALFDPVANTFVYYRAAGSYSLSYPFLDADGSLWTCDFLAPNPGIYRFAPDASSAKRWELPISSAPSKVIRGVDGAIWVSLYASAQLARLDPTTNEIRIYQLPYADLPYDLLNYKDRIVFTEQRNNLIGMIDPKGATPVETVTVTPIDETVISTTRNTVQITSTLTPTTATITPAPTTGITGFSGSGLTYYSAGAGTNYALLLDERRGRIWFGSGTTISTLLPPLIQSSDRVLPSAASIWGRFGSQWKTEIVSWNRGLAKDSSGAATSVSWNERLLPSRWIVGISPTAAVTLAPGQMTSQPDAIGNEMKGPGTFGGITLTASASPAEVFAWGRVSVSRDGGGSYGFAQSFVSPDRGIGPNETGELFTAPDPATQRTNAGIFVTEFATGRISVVDASGATLGSTPFDFPAGYHTQLSTVFDAFHVAPSASARVVVSVTFGRVFLFGTSIDNVTNDPILLATQKTPLQYASFLQTARGAGPLGASAKTTVQIHNPSGSAATVTLVFHAAAAEGGSAPAARSASFTVDAGKVLTLDDALGSLGVGSGSGTLDLAASTPVFAFARVTAAAASGGSFGYGIALVSNADAIAPGSRGVFLGVAQNGAIRSDLTLVNVSDTAASVALQLFNAAGAAAGSRTVTVPPRTTVDIANVWTSAGGSDTDLGRLDVVPADGSGSVLASLLRQDRVTGDADPVAPFVMAR